LYDANARDAEDSDATLTPEDEAIREVLARDAEDPDDTLTPEDDSDDMRNTR
jgi:hypothetical protein